ncbi:sporulation protein YpjB [Paenibacillus sp. strain BS8-2]
MKTRIIVPFVICVFMTIGSVSVVWGGPAPTANLMFPFADRPYDMLFRMDETAVALYGAANENNRQYAYAQVQKLQKGLKNELLLSYGDETGWEKLSEDLVVIESALIKGISHTEWRERAARVRLAIDAVTAGSGSLWYQYRRLLQDDVQLVGQALKRSTDDRESAANAALALMATMSAHVNRIEPSAAMNGQALRMDELKQRLAYSEKLIALMKDNNSASATELRTALQSLEGASVAIDNIFQMDAKDDVAALAALTEAPSIYPLQWSFFIGTLISAVLTFVGWRKYKQKPYGVKSIK